MPVQAHTHMHICMSKDICFVWNVATSSLEMLGSLRLAFAAWIQMTSQKQFHHAHLCEVQALLARGALANACDNEGVSPLLACIEASPDFRLDSTTDTRVFANDVVDGKQASVQVSGTGLASDFHSICT